MFHKLGENLKAKQYVQRALAIRIEMGDRLRRGEVADYGNLGTVYMSLGQYDKVKEYLQKALVIRTEIGDKEGEAVAFENQGTVFKSLGQYDKVKIISKKLWSSELKLTTEKERHHVMET